MTRQETQDEGGRERERWTDGQNGLGRREETEFSLLIVSQLLPSLSLSFSASLNRMRKNERRSEDAHAPRSLLPMFRKYSSSTRSHYTVLPTASAAPARHWKRVVDS